MHSCMYRMYIVCMHACMHKCVYVALVCMYVYMYLYVCVHACVDSYCIRACVCTVYVYACLRPCVLLAGCRLPRWLYLLCGNRLLHMHLAVVFRQKNLPLSSLMPSALRWRL